MWFTGKVLVLKLNGQGLVCSQLLISKKDSDNVILEIILPNYKGYIEAVVQQVNVRTGWLCKDK